MCIFRIVLLLSCLLAFSTSGAISTSAPSVIIKLNLSTAIERAIGHNRRLARSALSIAQAHLGIDSAETEFDFTITPDGSASMASSENRWQAGMELSQKLTSGARIAMRGQVVQRNSDSSSAKNWRSSVRVDITQPLFSDFGPLIHKENLRLAGERLDRERRRWEMQKMELAVDVVKTFESIIGIERQIKSDESFFERTDRLYRLTLARERQGRATRVDALRVELQRGQALARLENNRERIFSLYRDLAELTGYPQTTEFSLIPAPLTEIELPSTEDAIETAFLNRLDFAQVLQDHRRSIRDVKIASRKLRPDLSLLLSTEQFNEDATFSGSSTLEENAWLVGLSGGTDLMRRQERIALKAAELDTQSMQELIDITGITITREVLQAISSYRRSGSEAIIEERNFQLAQSRVTLAQRMYDAGRVDNFSVTDAEDAFIKAEVKLLTAQAGYVVSGYVLLQKMGILFDVPDDLKAGE